LKLRCWIRFATFPTSFFCGKYMLIKRVSPWRETCCVFDDVIRRRGRIVFYLIRDPPKILNCRAILRIGLLRVTYRWGPSPAKDPWYLTPLDVVILLQDLNESPDVGLRPLHCSLTCGVPPLNCVVGSKASCTLKRQ
jgi:hypothetical protein